MRYALISDIHSNIEAFDAVLRDIDSTGADRLLFLGDIIGYGPNPNECLDRLLQVADLSLGGNHDWAVVGKTPDDYFNPFAKQAVDWTAATLRDDHKDFLKRTRAADTFDGFQVAHSTPLYPEEWRYIMSQKEALENYGSLTSQVCFIGHSHQPLVIEYDGPASIKVSKETGYTLDPAKKYIINIGSVGQPRDSNINSCWALYDSEEGTVTFRRVPYDIEAVQRKMAEANLPRYLIDRLAVGR
ncbi:MAG: metallophosphoesterase family protein [Nitrospinae bacterium]|nr:metallophosphoesterase family protein [Nitrospinota bacterium]